MTEEVALERAEPESEPESVTWQRIALADGQFPTPEQWRHVDVWHKIHAVEILGRVVPMPFPYWSRVYTQIAAMKAAFAALPRGRWTEGRIRFPFDGEPAAAVVEMKDGRIGCGRIMPDGQMLPPDVMSHPALIQETRLALAERFPNDPVWLPEPEPERPRKKRVRRT